MLYLDSADRAGLEPLLRTGLFAGVTTNPTILQRAGLDASHVADLSRWARDRGAARFFAQATGESVDELRRSADVIAALGDDVVVKLVSTTSGLTVAKELADAGREVLVTAVYHPGQFSTANAAGARYLAPYIGRANEAGRDGIAMVAAMTRMAAMTEGATITRILAASLRTIDDVAAVSAAGAHDVTLSVPVARSLLADELTLAATAEFEAVAASAARPVLN